MKPSYELTLGPMDKERACPYCGTVFMPRSAKHQYCTSECCRRYTLEQAERPIPEEFQCPHNNMIVCQVRRCGECGWNPVVARRRTERILRACAAN